MGPRKTTCSLDSPTEFHAIGYFGKVGPNLPHGDCCGVPRLLQYRENSGKLGMGQLNDDLIIPKQKLPGLPLQQCHLPIF